MKIYTIYTYTKSI